MSSVDSFEPKRVLFVEEISPSVEALGSPTEAESVEAQAAADSFGDVVTVNSHEPSLGVDSHIRGRYR